VALHLYPFIVIIHFEDLRYVLVGNSTNIITLDKSRTQFKAVEWFPFAGTQILYVWHLVYDQTPMQLEHHEKEICKRPRSLSCRRKATRRVIYITVTFLFHLSTHSSINNVPIGTDSLDNNNTEYYIVCIRTKNLKNSFKGICLHLHATCPTLKLGFENQLSAYKDSALCVGERRTECESSDKCAHDDENKENERDMPEEQKDEPVTEKISLSENEFTIVQKKKRSTKKGTEVTYRVDEKSQKPAGTYVHRTGTFKQEKFGFEFIKSKQSCVK
jgi:hypothetical protein